MELYFENVQNIEFKITTDGGIITVDWGDATINNNLSHNYGSSYTGIVKITITGASYILFGHDWDKMTGIDKLVRVDTFGNIPISRLANAFNGASNLIIVPLDLPITVTDLRATFFDAKNFNDSNIGSWNVSNVINMNATFYNATNFNGNISNWDTSNVIFMNAMFLGASNFNGNINSWNTSNVGTMQGMFINASNINQDLNN